MVKRKVIEIDSLSQDMQAVYDVLNKESSLAAVLIGVNFLDQCLGSLLSHHFIKGSTSEALLDPNNGILGTFGSRMKLSYCLGIISKNDYNELQIMAETRNIFAHSHATVNFKTPAIVDLCDRLSYLEKLKLAKSNYGPRSKFDITVALMAQRLVVLALSAKKKQKQPSAEWI